MSAASDESHAKREAQLTEQERVNSNRHQWPVEGQLKLGPLLSVCCKAPVKFGIYWVHGKRVGMCSECHDEAAEFLEQVSINQNI